MTLKAPAAGRRCPIKSNWRGAMLTIGITEELYQRVEAFTDLYRAVTNEDTDISTCIGVLIDRGFRAALSDVLQGQEQAVLVESFRQLATRHPHLVCRYMADMVGLGADIHAQGDGPPHIGF